VSCGPGDLLDFDVDVGVFLFESRDELRENFTLASHGPNAERRLISC
jgi:hypothetical protein